MDTITRTFAQVRIIVEVDPIIGDPPTWANAIAIAEECIDKVVIPRYKEYEAKKDSND